jgi:hypothetical protein
MCMRGTSERSGALGVAMVLKFFLWPLLAWETGRAGVRAALRVSAAGLLLAGAS